MKNRSISHVLIIPDGNRRWAKLHEVSLNFAYAHALFKVTTDLIQDILIQNNVPILTIFMLSSKNISKRPLKELKPIYLNFIKVFDKWAKNKKFLLNGIKFNFIGERQVLPRNLLSSLDKLLNATKKNKKKQCNLLIGYDAEREFIHVVNTLLKNRKKKISKAFKHMLLKEPIDIIIRTGQEKRLSGSPLMQSASAEIFFLDSYYPDLNKNHLQKIFADFKSRKRRLGK